MGGVDGEGKERRQVRVSHKEENPCLVAFENRSFGSENIVNGMVHVLVKTEEERTN